MLSFSFFFNDTATTEIYTLSLHDALPIFPAVTRADDLPAGASMVYLDQDGCSLPEDGKSTRLNSSHVSISYAVFCLKKKKNIIELYSCNTKKLTKPAITDIR